MANWGLLKAAIADVIKENNNQEITGFLLQSVLSNIVTNLGENATFAGVATADTNPGLPDGPVFYLSTTAGVYSNFNGIVIENGEAVILEWKNGTWVKYDCGFATKEAVQKVENMHVPPMTQKQFDDLEASGKLVEGAYYSIYEDE